MDLSKDFLETSNKACLLESKSTMGCRAVDVIDFCV
jgi:hypothetical protein